MGLNIAVRRRFRTSKMAVNLSSAQDRPYLNPKKMKRKEVTNGSPETEEMGMPGSPINSSITLSI
jgi:hypothetical protein